MRVLVSSDDPLMLAGLELMLKTAVNVSVSLFNQHNLSSARVDHRTADVILIAGGRLNWTDKSHQQVPMMWGARGMEPSTALSLMRAAAMGLTCLDCHLDTLIDGLRELHSGAGYIAPCIVGRLVSFLRGETDSAGKFGMTARELQILRRIAEGAPNAAIASELKIEIRTVKHYASGIYRKLGATGRAEAVALAFKNGLTA